MDTGSTGAQGGETLLFLTDEQLRKGIEAMFFAYRAFTSDPDRILENYEYGRAHHRAIHFINRQPGLTVTALLATLGVTKQSLNRVLRASDDPALIKPAFDAAQSIAGEKEKAQALLDIINEINYITASQQS